MAEKRQDEFVDLYKVLELATDAPGETIRTRLNTLYLEAQQNLDHRNVKKRLQFQQMYEIYLPQARHLLLDPRRRGEYDRYLAAYLTGNKVAPTSEPESPPLDEMSKIEEAEIPGMAEVEVDPAVVAAERENIWAKWKQGLETVAEAAPVESNALTATPAVPVAQAAPIAQVAPVARTTPLAQPGARRSTPEAARPGAPTRTSAAPPRPTPRAAPLSPGAAPARPAPPAPRSPQAARGLTPAPDAAQANETAAASEMERQREQQRYALIKDAVLNAGLVWGAVYAGAVFLLGCIALFVLDGSLKPKYPLGLTQTSFAAVGFLLVLGLAAVAGLLGRRSAKRRTVSELSLLSMEELMRRNRS